MKQNLEDLFDEKKDEELIAKIEKKNSDFINAQAEIDNLESETNSQLNDKFEAALNRLRIWTPTICRQMDLLYNSGLIIEGEYSKEEDKPFQKFSDINQYRLHGNVMETKVRLRKNKILRKLDKWMEARQYDLRIYGEILEEHEESRYIIDLSILTYGNPRNERIEFDYEVEEVLWNEYTTNDNEVLHHCKPQYSASYILNADHQQFLDCYKKHTPNDRLRLLNMIIAIPYLADKAGEDISSIHKDKIQEIDELRKKISNIEIPELF